MPDSLGDILASRTGHYVLVDLWKPNEPAPALLVAVGADYLTLSARSSVFHLPLTSIYTVIDTVIPGLQGWQLSVFLRHEFVPTSGGRSWWVGFSIPIGQ